jgi:hypothetical protein
MIFDVPIIDHILLKNNQTGLGPKRKMKFVNHHLNIFNILLQHQWLKYVKFYICMY